MSLRADEYDVMIVGGGPAGTSAAIHLALGGARVLLAEQKKFPRAKLCGEFISPECLTHFARLGVLPRMIEAGGREVARTIFYVRSGRSVEVPSEWFGAARTTTAKESNGAWGGGAALGLSRAEMDEQLLVRAREVGVEVLEETRGVGLLCEGARVCGVQLKTGDGATDARRALLTIDATGRTRALARHVERAKPHLTSKRRAELVAFKAHLEGARGGDGACEIYFYRGGYGGLSPVEGGRSNLCFIASARDVRARGGDPTRVMREVVQANRRADAALRDARVSSEWLSVALEGFGRRALVPLDGLVAAGDAASFIDPFTGSGMLMALESGELASEVLTRWLPRLRDTDALDARGLFASFAQEYGARYDARFGARLRLCAWLRRAAFAPPALAEAAAVALGASAHMRRALARATRGLQRAHEGVPSGVEHSELQLRATRSEPPAVAGGSHALSTPARYRRRF